MPNSSYESIAQVLKIIAHPCRLQIVDLLNAGEMSVARVQKMIHCKQSVTSQHLNKMKNEGILKARRTGNTVYYSINNKDVTRILRCLKYCPLPTRRETCLKN